MEENHIRKVDVFEGLWKGSSMSNRAGASDSIDRLAFINFGESGCKPIDKLATARLLIPPQR
jgi:hypothetical protein